MSSLRLALKQSLAEAGHLLQDQKKKKRKKPRRQLDSSSHTAPDDEDVPGDSHADSSLSDGDMGEDEDLVLGFSSGEEDGEIESGDEQSPTDGGTEDGQQNQKKIKKLEKSMKQRAANKIQNQWKKSKGKSITEASHDGPSREAEVAETANPDGEKSPTASPTEARPRKKKAKNKTVPPPAPEVLEWARALSEKKCRKHVDTGLRVKVRFSTKVRREGKLLTKKKWYGGRVTAKNKDGSKIRIKYDDGTTEVATFPDKDIVVDATGNGEHSAVADRFIPPFKAEESADAVMSVGEVVPPPLSSGPSQSTEASGVVLEKDVASRDGVGQTLEKKEGGSRENETRGSSKDYGVSAGLTTEGIGNDASATKMPGREESKKSPGGPLKPTTAAENTELKGATSIAESNLSDEKNFDVQESAPVPGQQSDKSKIEGQGNPAETEPEAPIDGDKAENRPSLTIRISSSKVKEALEGDEQAEQLADNEASRKRAAEEIEGEMEEPAKKRLHIKAVAPNQSTLEATASEKVLAGLGGQLSNTGKTEGDPAHNVSSSQSAVLHASEKKQSLPAPVAQEGVEAEDEELKGISGAVPQGKKDKKKPPSRASSPKPSRPLSPHRGRSPAMDVSSHSGQEVADPVQEADPGIIPESTSTDAAVTAKVGDDATEDSKIDMSGDSKAELKSLTPKIRKKLSSDSLVRSGRRAAQEANEKMTSKEPGEEGTRKKKRKREVDGNDSDGSVEENPDQWIQCDSCSKWRVLPSHVDVASLPKHWYCRMNTYDPKRSSCDAPEQSAKQLAKQRKRAKRRARKKLEHSEEKEAIETKEKKRGSPLSPLPDGPDTTVAVLTSRKPPSPSIEEAPQEKEKVKKAKKTKSVETEASAASDLPPPDVKPKGKPGRKRGRPARSESNRESDRDSTGVTSARSSVADKPDADNVEWVQCDKCGKWRKISKDISADDLPDTWYCSMNTWNAASASCDAPEDKADALHQDVNTGQFGAAGKFSYRSLIFGLTGKKYNRPTSERTRAAESLFSRPTEDQELPCTRVMYADSSMFQPRISNFAKKDAVTEKKPTMFEVMTEAGMWSHLCGSSSSEADSGSVNRYKYYDTLKPEEKEGFKDIVLRAVGLQTLSANQVLAECLVGPWVDIPSSWQDLRRECNEDIVINTLLELVRDGVLEMSCDRSNPNPISTWTPLYRRSRRKPSLDLRGSRCMKISKPWKRREMSSPASARREMSP